MKKKTRRLEFDVSRKDRRERFETNRNPRYAVGALEIAHEYGDPLPEWLHGRLRVVLAARAEARRFPRPAGRPGVEDDPDRNAIAVEVHLERLAASSVARRHRLLAPRTRLDLPPEQLASGERSEVFDGLHRGNPASTVVKIVSHKPKGSIHGIGPRAYSSTQEPSEARYPSPFTPGCTRPGTRRPPARPALEPPAEICWIVP